MEEVFNEEGGREVAVVDGALRGGALQSLLSLCTDSTVFHEARANGTSHHHHSSRLPVYLPPGCIQ